MNERSLHRAHLMPPCRNNLQNGQTKNSTVNKPILFWPTDASWNQSPKSNMAHRTCSRWGAVIVGMVLEILAGWMKKVSLQFRV